MSISASTKLYGIFQPNILGIEAFRHTITPAITYNFKPDFSKESWGYFDTYITPDGKKIRYDKFGKEIYGGSGAGENQHISFSIGNVFEIKTAKDPRDTTKNSESNKIQLLNLDANIGYNFAADSLRLSELRVGYRTQIGNLLSFYGSSIFTFYDYVLIDPASGTYRQVNRFLIDQGKGLFRLTNFAFSVSTNLAGEKSEDKRSVQKAEDFDAFKKKDYITTYDETQSPDFSIPWNLSLSYNFNLIKTNPNKAEKYSNLSANLSFSLTNNWKFTVRGSYDFELKQISAPQITVYRDLHCWELNFSWNPIGFYRGYRFEIRMKAPELQDIKVTKSKGIYSGRR
jgi:hypothetical protein